ncbi:MAG: Bax inhibitor-1/YccA family protein [Bacillota bacterium]|nr:Bax inhibitor-1/YccA family protein [Bacillota bacterium]
MEYNQNNYYVQQKDSLAHQYVRVYGWMFLGLIITGLVAYFTVTGPILDLIANRFTILLFFVAELALVWYLSSRTMRMQYVTAATVFILYSALNGITMSLILLAYTTFSIAYVFLITAAFFGFMSIYGVITKQDLTSMGSLLFMGLIGIIIASIVNILLRNEMLYWIISFIGVAVFLGLTAYDSQKIKKIHAAYAGTDREKNVAIIGALSLYLDFINLFLFILRLLGRRR